ncbi:MAG: ABC transporter permease [Pseudanabaena sp.]|jgi:peptide/nickel transport system permease protein|nr:ABC transporter permease [Pseudanabaena sp. M53BS1SP1A06MG]MCA6581692.1 ABC transporter permease [Pseudanabaena sp. M34BS1SP1A06MG]MCA6585704.1 ABC transporter permease [Pseudanabaena sp. M051S1SP1A06QC]MCA6591322.1 ABC transporter permease [Pseudanabaena sp. M38BS1SP1A06MG]MCA6599540.1 ABC transporter permease [Pseudanabaena sp. M57BS1SP1A06MG]MCA6612300.1 ABC transporter permease [Pseudanabaena sp. M158S2SP1A06QC]MCE2975136.1 ABC transporter permease [Pseudanabaena sp. CoA8_M7]
MSSRLKALFYYITARLLLAPLMLWAIASIVFLLMRATPGDPIDAILGPRAPEDVKVALREQVGLTGSLFSQYGGYMKDLLHFNLGKSISTREQTVWQIIKNFFPATAELAIYALIVALVVGLTVGIIAALRPNTKWDVGGRLFGIITYSLPLFWVGMILQLVFSVQLGLLPIGTRFPASIDPPMKVFGLYTLDALLKSDWKNFWISLQYLILPATSLGIVISGIFERIMRVNLRQTLQSDYVEAAKARGIKPSAILFNHALKNAMIPVITILGLTLASMLGGAVLTEVTFSWPGLANRLFEAIVGRDYPVVQGIVVFFAIIVTVTSILVDIVNAWIDPRIRY